MEIILNIIINLRLSWFWFGKEWNNFSHSPCSSLWDLLLLRLPPFLIRSRASVSPKFELSERVSIILFSKYLIIFSSFWNRSRGLSWSFIGERAHLYSFASAKALFSYSRGSIFSFVIFVSWFLDRPIFYSSLWQPWRIRFCFYLSVFFLCACCEVTPAQKT